MQALGAAADFIASGRPKDALEVIMRRFHGLNIASQSSDPSMPRESYESLSSFSRQGPIGNVRLETP